MRCLILTQYYPPETGAAPNRLSDWAQRLAAGGHQVTVLTAVPNYPRGEIFPEYRDHLLYEEKRGNLRVLLLNPVPLLEALSLRGGFGALGRRGLRLGRCVITGLSCG